MDPFMQSRMLAASYPDAPRPTKKAQPARSCRVCSCTDIAACIGPDDQPCHWVEDDLCSACDAKLKAV